MARPAKVLDPEPIRDALRKKALLVEEVSIREGHNKGKVYEGSIRNLGRQWSRFTGRELGGCYRALTRVFDEPLISHEMADKICIEVLGIQPELLYEQSVWFA